MTRSGALHAERVAAAMLRDHVLEDDTRVVILSRGERAALVVAAPDSANGHVPECIRMEMLSPDDPRRVCLRHHRRTAAARLRELRHRETFESFTGPAGAEPELVAYLREMAALSTARAQVNDARLAAHLEGSIPAAVRAITEVLATALEPDEMPELPHRRRRHTDDTATATPASVPTHAPHAPPVGPHTDHCRRSGITHRGRAPS